MTSEKRKIQNRMIELALADIDRVSRVYCRGCLSDCNGCVVPIVFEQAKECMKRVLYWNEIKLEEREHE